MLSPARPSFNKTFVRLLRWLFAAAILLAICWLLWGADLLISSDPVPQHVDAAVVLQGSIIGERVRIAGAMNFLQRGIADRALVSVPKESYWGESIPPVARGYLERTYGNDLAARVDFCVTSEDVDSTIQEARALRPCIHEHQWHSVAIVTSNYHTRRAGMLFRKAGALDPGVHIWVEGVADPEFQQPWWRRRQSAKIFVMESMKLVWTVLGGR